MDKARLEAKRRRKNYFKKSRIVIFFTVASLLVAGFVVGFVFLIKSRTKYMVIEKAKNDEAFPNFESLTMNSNEYKLPMNLIPYYYDLYLITNFNHNIEPMDYNGTVEIHFKCIIETNKIILNTKNLEIDGSLIFVNDVVDSNITFNMINVTVDKRDELLIIELDRYFESNHNYTVYITFRGFLNDDDHGFFRLSYKDTFGNKRYCL